MHIFGRLLNQQLDEKNNKVPLFDIETGAGNSTDQFQQNSQRPHVFNPNIDRSYRTSRLDSCLAITLVTGICLMLIMLVTFIALHYKHQYDYDGVVYNNAVASEVEDYEQMRWDSSGINVGINGQQHGKVDRKNNQHYKGTNDIIYPGLLVENDMVKLDDEDFNGLDSDNGGGGDSSDTMDDDKDQVGDGEGDNGPEGGEEDSDILDDSLVRAITFSTEQKNRPQSVLSNSKN